MVENEKFSRDIDNIGVIGTYTMHIVSVHVDHMTCCFYNNIFFFFITYRVIFVSHTLSVNRCHPVYISLFVD